MVCYFVNRSSLGHDNLLKSLQVAIEEKRTNHVINPKSVKLLLWNFAWIGAI